MADDNGKAVKKNNRAPCGRQGCVLDPTRASELAKTGMAACLGLLVLTGFSRTRTARRVHVWAGVGLVGLGIWHHSIYQVRRDGGS